MKARPLSVPGAWEFTPTIHGDDRGFFLEWFRADVFADAVGAPMPTLMQANHSMSARGVVRGIHLTLLPPGQAKYVYCPQGAVLDVVVDVRVGSPTFGTWDAVRLDGQDRRAVYLSPGLGHAFFTLEDRSMVTYLCSSTYDPARDVGTHPLDPALELPWPEDIEPQLSAKDSAAPTLAEAADQGLLPTWAECIAAGVAHS